MKLSKDSYEVVGYEGYNMKLDKFYEAYIRYNNTESVIIFYVLHNIDIENHQIETLIFNLITDHLPLDNIVQRLRNGNPKTGQYKMINYSFHEYGKCIERTEGL